MELHTSTRALLSRFDTLSVTTPTYQMMRMDALVRGCIIDRNWDNFDAFYVFACDNQTVARQNWAQNAYNLTEVNSPTWTKYLGYTGDGATMYLDTGFTPTASDKFKANSMSFGVFSARHTLEPAATTMSEMGTRNGGSNLFRLSVLTDDNFFKVAIGDTEVGVFGNHFNSIGFYAVYRQQNPEGVDIGYRTKNTRYRTFRSGATGTVLPASDFFILAENDDSPPTGDPVFFSSRTLSFAFIGNGKVDLLKLHRRVKEYLEPLDAIQPIDTI